MFTLDSSRKNTMDTSPIHEVVKAAPPVAVSVMSVTGITISDVALFVTIIYTLLLMFVLIRDKIWNYKDKREMNRTHVIDRRHKPSLWQIAIDRIIDKL